MKIAKRDEKYHAFLPAHEPGGYEHVACAHSVEEARRLAAECLHRRVDALYNEFSAMRPAIERLIENETDTENRNIALGVLRYLSLGLDGGLYLLVKGAEDNIKAVGSDPVSEVSKYVHIPPYFSKPSAISPGAAPLPEPEPPALEGKELEAKANQLIAQQRWRGVGRQLAGLGREDFTRVLEAAEKVLAGRIESVAGVHGLDDQLDELSAPKPGSENGKGEVANA